MCVMAVVQINNTFRLYEKEHNLALLNLTPKRCKCLVCN